MTKKSNQLLNAISGKNFQLCRVDKLKPYDNNARKHSSTQIEKLSRSIQAFGFIAPVIIDAHNCIIAGHARVEAAKKAGLENVPVVKVDHLTENQKIAYIIADNRLAELAEWDADLLKIELDQLVQAGLSCKIDFDLTITGFENAEIDIFLGDVEESDDDASNLLESIEDKPPVSRAGDVWILGNHKILCGDSLNKENYQLLMGKSRARILCTDPPYNVRIDGFVSGNGANKHREFAAASGEMSPGEFTHFLGDFLENSAEVLVGGAILYVFMDWRHDKELQAAATRCDLKQVNLCIWDKGSGGMGSFYRSQHELVFVYKLGSAPHTNNIMLGKHGRNRTNVWHHPSANMSREGREALKSHPTPKPVSLLCDIIKDSTKAGDVVLDPFLGSGSTLLASEKTHRRCHGIEIDPLYVDLSIRRWQETTGKEVIHSESGKTFNQHEAAGLQVKTARIRERSYVSKK